MDINTPLSLYKELDKQFHFWCDCAATAQNSLAQHYISPERNYFKTELPDRGQLFLNPPRDDFLDQWIQKMYNHVKKTAQWAVLLLPNTQKTLWYRDYCVGPGITTRIYNPDIQIVIYQGSVMGSKDAENSSK